MVSASNGLFCISCGCSEHDACAIRVRGFTVGCSWVVKDRAAGVGVCSAQACRGHLNRWDAGDRKFTPEAQDRSDAAKVAHG